MMCSIPGHRMRMSSLPCNKKASAFITTLVNYTPSFLFGAKQTLLLILYMKYTTRFLWALFLSVTVRFCVFHLKSHSNSINIVNQIIEITWRTFASVNCNISQRRFILTVWHRISNKPSYDPVLAFCHQNDKYVLWEKCIWKCPLQNGGQFVSVAMYWQYFNSVIFYCRICA